MVNPVTQFVKRNPVTSWAGVGVVCYIWKHSMVATQYQRNFNSFDQARKTEIFEVESGKKLQ